jgi:transcriptional regulator with XRE-family HTH domain
MMEAGLRLRQLREQLGLTIRDVEAAASVIAAKYNNQDYSLSLSRLSDIESKGVLPSIFRLYALAAIYRRDIRDLFALYGIDCGQLGEDSQLNPLPKTHRYASLRPTTVRMPVRLDPGFDLQETTNLGRMVAKWGIVPLELLSQFENSDYSFGYIGAKDFTMYPLLMPGSLVQIDEMKNKVIEGDWRSEYERPIYFIEMRDGFACCWCSLDGNLLVLHPHPLSHCRVRVKKHPQEAEILGQVVGMAMRLDVVSSALRSAADDQAGGPPKRQLT